MITTSFSRIASQIQDFGLSNESSFLVLSLSYVQIHSIPCHLKAPYLRAKIFRAYLYSNFWYIKTLLSQRACSAYAIINLALTITPLRGGDTIDRNASHIHTCPAGS